MKGKGVHQFMNSPLRWLCDGDAHHRVIAAAIFAVFAVVATHFHVSIALRLVVGWTSFSVALVVLAWVRILSRDPTGDLDYIKTAKLQDFGQGMIFLRDTLNKSAHPANWSFSGLFESLCPRLSSDKLRESTSKIPRNCLRFRNGRFNQRILSVIGACCFSLFIVGYLLLTAREKG